MKALMIVAVPAAALFAAAPASAQFLSTNEPAPGYSSILNSDYSTAEREIRAAQVSPTDPARAINLGVVLAKTGRRAEAAEQFQRVLSQDDVELVVADGNSLSSHDVARRALAALQGGVLSH